MDSSAVETKPRWERRKDARPAELLAAALDLFVDRGYAGTRLDDVAARAGVSKGTLYLYFANKEELFKAVVRENIVRNIAEAAAAFESHVGTSADLLNELVRGWWSTMSAARAGGISKLMMAESGNFPEIASFYNDEVIRPAHALIERTIRRGIDSGEFRPVDVDLFTRVLIAPIVMLTLWQNSFGPCCNEPIDAERYLAVHIDAFTTALRARRGAAAGRASASAAGATPPLRGATPTLRPAPASSGRAAATRDRAATERRTGGAKRRRAAKAR